MPCWRAPRGLSRVACAACPSAGTCASMSQPSRLLCSDGQTCSCILAGLVAHDTCAVFSAVCVTYLLLAIG